MTLQVKLLLIVAALNFVLGYLVVRNDRNATKILFSVVALSVSLWSLNIALFLQTQAAESAFVFSVLYYIFAAAIPLAFFLFSCGFLTREILQSTRYLLYSIPFILLVAIFVFNPHFVIKEILLSGTKERDVVLNNFGYMLYSIYFIFYVVWSYVVLLKTYSAIHEKNEKSQLILILIGTFVSYILGMVFNLILPFLGNYQLIWIGPLFSLMMVSSIAYAILKHHLFDIKLILVEISLTLLNLSLFINVFLSNGTPNFILNGVIFLGILIFSILLLRSIYKDIRDREYIETLAKDMEKANERLRAMEQSKIEFVSIASHQLRTPLTVIKGYASMILEGTFGKLSEQAQVAMNNLYQSSEKVVALVEDLLTVSRIEQGRMMLVLKPMDFVEFVQTTITEMEGKIKALGLDLAFTIEEEKGFLVPIDEKKMKQVIVHLLDNAIKYTKAPGTITVALSLDDATRKVHMTISDTGAGMTPRQIRAISDRFDLHIEDEEKGKKLSIEDLDTAKAPKDASLESDDTGIRNGGIGLYISQEIVQAHHGTLRIESGGLGKGTTVVVELPQAEK